MKKLLEKFPFKEKFPEIFLCNADENKKKLLDYYIYWCNVMLHLHNAHAERLKQ